MSNDSPMVFGQLEDIAEAKYSGLLVRVDANGRFLQQASSSWTDEQISSFFGISAQFTSKKPVRSSVNKLQITPIFPGQPLRDAEEGYVLLTFDPATSNENRYPLFFPSVAYQSFIGKPDAFKTKMDEYTEVKHLGKGAFGEVKLVKDKDGKQWARKQIDLTKFMQTGKPRCDAEKEPALQQTLQHANIIQVKEYYSSEDMLYIIIEYANKKSMADYIREVKSSSALLQAPEILRLFIQCCQAVQHLHQRQIVHRDLKPDNFMLHQESEASPIIVKLADFGTAKANEAMNTVLGTPLYIAPEIIKSTGDYTNKVDVWSLGCMLYEMFEGATPFFGNGQMYDIQKRIQQGTYEAPQNQSCTQVYADLISSMLQTDVTKRFDIDDVLDVLLSEYFDSKMTEGSAPVGQTSSSEDLKRFRQMQKEIAKNEHETKAIQAEQVKIDKELQTQQVELDSLQVKKTELEAKLAKEQQQEQQMSAALQQMQLQREDTIKQKQAAEKTLQYNREESERLQKLVVEQKRQQLLFYTAQYSIQQVIAGSNPRSLQDLFVSRLIEIVYKSCVSAGKMVEECRSFTQQVALRFAQNYSKKNYQGYQTMAEFVEGVPRGYGTMRLPNGEYFGFLENGVAKGFGNMTYDSGDVYEGGWDRGKKCGMGKLTKANGDGYAGDWKDDAFNEVGRYHWANGEAQAGRWEQGQFKGQ